MSLYIVFDNLWSLMETSQSANLVDNTETAVTKSVNLTGVNVPEVTEGADLIEKASQDISARIRGKICRS